MSVQPSQAPTAEPAPRSTGAVAAPAPAPAVAAEPAPRPWEEVRRALGESRAAYAAYIDAFRARLQGWEGLESSDDDDDDRSEPAYRYFLAVLAHALDDYRRAEWIEYLDRYPTAWGTSSPIPDPESEPWKSLEEFLRVLSHEGQFLDLKKEFHVEAPGRHEDAWLRRSRPIGEPEAIAILDRHRGLRSPHLLAAVLQAVWRATGTLPGASTSGPDLAPPDDRADVEGRPAPRALEECLRRLLCQADNVRGCLYPDAEGYFWKKYPRHPDDAALWASAEAGVDWLRGRLNSPTPGEGQPPRFVDDLVRFKALGDLARRLRTRPEQPPARAARWCSAWLSNLEKLGDLAECLLPRPAPVAPPEPAPRPAPGPIPAELPAAISNSATTGPSPPVVPFDKARFDAVPTIATVKLLYAQPFHQCKADAWKAGWPGPLEDLEKLRAALTAFYDRSRDLARRVGGDFPASEEFRRDLGKSARELSDLLFNTLVRLDDRLPGDSEDGPMPVPGPPEFVARLAEVRDRLYQFVRDHGGYEVLEVRLGDDPTRYGDELDFQGRVESRRFAPSTIAQVVRRGYVQVRDGRRALIRKPRVNLAQE